MLLTLSAMCGAVQSGDSCTKNQGNAVGHYTAVVWAETTHVGCGMATCTDNSGGNSDGWLLGGWVCNYYPGGNMNGIYPYCHGNNPSEVGECDGFVYDATKDPDGCGDMAVTTSCDETGAGQCSTDDPCALGLTWPEIDAAEASGTKVFTGGLGSLMDANHESWLCWEDSGCAAGDLACFKYHENDEVFEWYGFNSQLRIVDPSLM